MRHARIIHFSISAWPDSPQDAVLCLLPAFNLFRILPDRQRALWLLIDQDFDIVRQIPEKAVPAQDRLAIHDAFHAAAVGLAQRPFRPFVLSCAGYRSVAPTVA